MKVKGFGITNECSGGGLAGFLLALCLTASSSAAVLAQTRYTGPVVDVNVRSDPLTPERLREFDRFRVTHAMIFGRDSLVGAWSRQWSGKVIRSITLPCPARNCFPDGDEFPDVAWVRAELAAGRLHGLGELMQQFAGMRPDDPKLEPYFALAEEFDVPVSVHLSLAPPWVTRNETPFRVYLGKPELIENVLARHRRLRVIISHAGYPWIDAITAILYMYPNVSVDISAIALPRFLPTPVFHEYLRHLVSLGFTDRLMFGTDVEDPSATGETVNAVESALFLSLDQKRAIFCGNAMRFFRLADLHCQ